jgi:hypothetical protein
MKANGLGKLYDVLAPRERLPLILAASARGDERERSRLMQSARKELYRLPDYHGQAVGLRLLSLVQHVRVLERATHFYRALALLVDPGEEAKGEASPRRLLGTARLLAYALVIEIDGWRAFCAKLAIDPDQLVRSLGSYATVQAAEEEARAMALTPGGVVAELRRCGKEPAGLLTAEAIAASWELLLAEQAAAWE